MKIRRVCQNQIETIYSLIHILKVEIYLLLLRYVLITSA